MIPYAMNECCSSPVHGVGDFGDLLGGLGDFFSSGVGAELLKTGLSFGVGYGLHELTAPKHASAPGNLSGGSGVTVNPAGSGLIPQAGGAPVQPQPQQSAATPVPSWLLPVAVVGGLGVLALALRR